MIPIMINKDVLEPSYNLKFIVQNYNYVCTNLISIPRALEKKKERAEKRIAELEKEIEKLDEELFGSAASDYVRAAEIEERKAKIDEELLELYELVM